MIYTVIGEVDLFLLAAWFYGSAGLWDIIYYANKDIIGDDPENVTAGMTLEIPEIETSEKKYLIPAPVGT